MSAVTSIPVRDNQAVKSLGAARTSAEALLSLLSVSLNDHAGTTQRVA